MGRGTEEQLAALHGVVANQLVEALSAEPPDVSDEKNPSTARLIVEAWAKNRLAVIDRSIKFLKDNNITAAPEVQASPLAKLQESIAGDMPSREALERLMTATPD